MKKFYINNNGELLNQVFNNADDAHSFINSQDDEDAYLMKIIELNEDEVWFIGFISESFESEIAEKIYSNDCYKKILFADSDRLTGSDWVTEKYITYFSKSVSEGDEAVIALDDFIDRLIKDIEFVKDYDGALLKYSA